MRLFISVRAGLKNTRTAPRRFLGPRVGLLRMLPGRATFRNLSRYSDYPEKTFSRWWAREFDGVSANPAAIRQGVAVAHEQVLACDPSLVPKSGKRT